MVPGQRGQGGAGGHDRVVRVHPAQLLDLPGGDGLAGQLRGEHRRDHAVPGLVGGRRGEAAQGSGVPDDQPHLLADLSHGRGHGALTRLELAPGQHERRRAALAHRQHPTLRVAQAQRGHHDRLRRRDRMVGRGGGHGRRGYRVPAASRCPVRGESGKPVEVRHRPAAVTGRTHQVRHRKSEDRPRGVLSVGVRAGASRATAPHPVLPTLGRGRVRRPGPRPAARGGRPRGGRRPGARGEGDRQDDGGARPGRRPPARGGHRGRPLLHGPA
ncbi:hypothetical protein NOMA109596_19325 [Nocardioides marinus]